MEPCLPLPTPPSVRNPLRRSGAALRAGPAALAGTPLLAAVLLSCAWAQGGSSASAARSVTMQSRASSEDDRGFSLRMTSPTDLYLSGKQMVRIETIIPRGDTVEGTDFYLDGKRLCSDRKPPYACQIDMGEDVRRHVLEVRATTHGGRHAKVSLVTASADVAEGAAAPLVTVAVVVRDAAGRPVPTLGVSDFVLTEEGAHRPVVHFASGPSPASVALLVEPEVPQGGALAAAFLRGLPPHAAVACLAGGATVPAPGDGAPKGEPAEEAGPRGAVGGASPAPGPSARASGASTASSAEAHRFVTDVEALARRAATGEACASVAPLAERARAAAALLAARHGPRVLLLLAASGTAAGTAAPPGAAADAGAETPSEQPAAGAPAGAGAPVVGAAPNGPVAADGAAVPGAPGETAASSEPPDPALAAAFQEIAKAGAALYVVAVPGNAGDAKEAALRGAAAASGGQFLAAADARAAEQALDAVGSALAGRYLLSYLPPEPGRAGWRSIGVTVRGEQVTVQAPRTVYLP